MKPDPRVINETDSAPVWSRWTDPAASQLVRKIVLGPSPGSNKPKGLAAQVPTDLAVRFPNLTHLYLWMITDLSSVPTLPESLRCLEVRDCDAVTSLTNLPASLETLVLGKCPKLAVVPDFPTAWAAASSIGDLGIDGCGSLPGDWIQRLIQCCPQLRRLEIVRCPQLQQINEWPVAIEDRKAELAPQLTRIDLDECSGLLSLPAHFPARLRRLSVRGCSQLALLPNFPFPTGQLGQGLDYLDLRDTRSLKSIPDNYESLRTLYLLGSGVELPSELFGGTDENVAAQVVAYLREAEQGTVPDPEVKVILLGNGRCGKTSLLRRLVDNVFDPLEKSTHGIQLRTTTLPFSPEDEPTQPTEATLNIWDFAGQDLYHNTHRTFLQSKAVYVLCRTNHGDGADTAGDTAKDPEREEGDDVRKTLRYWFEQIASLGVAPGMSGPPPIILVRMKADRDAAGANAAGAWDHCEAGKSLPRVNVSAKSGFGIDIFKEQLSKAVAQVLGRRDRRSLGRRPMGVKNRLREWKAANQLTARERQRIGKGLASPRTTFAKTEFDEMVRQHCPGSNYAKDPSLLLRHFHLSGFLYHDPAYIPDTVILDQPWALQAVYAVMRRDGSHSQLKAARGRFTAANVAEWAWSPTPEYPAGYSTDDQALFLRFMESHRVVAKLFEATETVDGLARYIAPYYLPEWAAIAGEVESMEAARGPVTATMTLTSPHLGRDVAQGLLIELIRRFSRAAELWRWGAYFNAFSLDASVRLEWSPHHALDSYGGEIRASYRGTAAPQLHEYLVARFRELPTFPRDAELVFAPVEPTLGGVEVPIRLGAEDRPHPTEAIGAGQGIEATTREDKLGVRVSISYAGSNPQSTDAVEKNLGALPKSLAHHLAQKHGIRVLEYSDTNRESNLRIFIGELLKHDYLVVFFSKKYFYSPYCMWELLLLYKEPPERRFAPGRARFLVAPGVPIARGGELEDFRDDWDQYWKSWCEDRSADTWRRSNNDPKEYIRRLPRMEAWPWYDFAQGDDQRNALLDAFVDHCFKVSITDPKAFEPDAQEFQAVIGQVANEIIQVLGKAETIYAIAVSLWQRAREQTNEAQRRETLEKMSEIYFRARRLERDFDESLELDRMENRPHISHQGYNEQLLNEIRRYCFMEATKLYSTPRPPIS